MSILKNIVIGLGAGLFFALLYAAGIINPLEERVYDFFLRGRPDRERIDNAVNLAARLEGVNKQYRTGGVLISEYTRNAIGDEFICRGLDRVRVVGINTPVRLYEVLGLRNEAGAAEQAALAAWEKALALYESRKFMAAGKIFNSIALRDKKDGPARLYMNMCRNYIAAPPPPDWDGVNNLSQK